ncbi:MAG: hypothetical protein WBV59_05735 [Anaerolineae bacterium]
MTPEELLQYCRDHGELYEIRISLPNRRYHSPVRRRLFGHLGGPTGYVVARDNGHAVVTFNRDDVMMALQRVLAPSAAGDTQGQVDLVHSDTGEVSREAA